MDNQNLPKTVTLEVFAHMGKHSDRIQLFMCDMSDHGYVCLGPVNVTFDVPQVDIVAAQIDSLEKVKTKLVEEYESKLYRINEQIQNLRALSYSAA